MKFKSQHLEDQLQDTPELLQAWVREFCDMSEEWGIEPTITRIADAVEGESGVHLDYRAVDFRDEFKGDRFYSDEEVAYLCNHFNQKYSRRDGKPTLLHHSFQGAPLHFHLQVAKNRSMYRDQDAIDRALES